MKYLEFLGRAGMFLFIMFLAGKLTEIELLGRIIISILIILWLVLPLFEKDKQQKRKKDEKK